MLLIGNSRDRTSHLTQLTVVCLLVSTFATPSTHQTLQPGTENLSLLSNSGPIALFFIDTAQKKNVNHLYLMSTFSFTW